MRSLRFPPVVARSLLRLGGVLLIAQTTAAWALVLGLWTPTGAFVDLPPFTRNAVVALAVLCPVAAIGTWFVSDWGPVLWAATVTTLGIAVVVGTPFDTMALATFAVHACAFVAWLVSAARVERRGERGEVLTR